MKNKYLIFKIIGHTPKTKIVEVQSKLHGYKLGIIKWYGAWWQYVFYPEKETLYSKGCMEDIIEYIKGLKNEVS